MEISKELFDSIKTLQSKMEGVLQPILEDVCPCDKNPTTCCRRMPHNRETDIVLIIQDGEPTEKDQVPDMCEYLTPSGCGVKGIKPQLCITFTCDLIANKIYQDGDMGQWNQFKKDLAQLYREASEELEAQKQ